MGDGQEAHDTVEKAKASINKKDYKAATTWMKSTLKLSPKLKEGFETLIISETLYYGTTDFPNFGTDWYSLLHLHPSATHTEVKLQSQMLNNCTKLMDLDGFPGASDALSLLKQAKYVLCDEPNRLEFGTKRKASGLIDVPVSGNPISFEERYLAWKPPVFKSGKKRSSSPCELSLFPQMKKLKQEVFDEMPQNPHFSPINKFCSKVRGGMMVGLDIVFITLCQEIRKLNEPQRFWSSLDGFMEQMRDFEKMGYTVDKLRECVEALKAIAERIRSSGEAVEEVKAEVREHNNVVDKHRSILLELETEIEQLKKLVGKCDSKIRIRENESMGIAQEFASAARSRWN